MLSKLLRWLRSKKLPTSQELAQYPDFSGASPQTLKDILATVALERHSAGTRIELYADPQRVLFLRTGTVKVMLHNGGEITLRHDALPRAGSLNRHLTSGSALICLDQVELLVADMSALSPTVKAREGDWVEQGTGGDFDEISLEDVSAEAGQLAMRIVGDVTRGDLELPVLPELALAIGRKLKDPDSTAEDVALLMQADASLSAKLLQVANSAAFAGYEPAHSVLEAVTRMGFSATRDLITGLSIKNLFHSDNPALRDMMKAQWEHSVKVAAVSAILAKQMGIKDPDRALLAGLMHDIGTLAVIQYASKLTSNAYEHAELEVAIRLLRGPLGAIILQSWHLDDAIIMAARLAEDYSRPSNGPVNLVDIVQVSQVHALAGQPALQGVPPIPELPAVRKLGLEVDGPERSIALLREARTEIDQIRRALAL